MGVHRELRMVSVASHEVLIGANGNRRWPNLVPDRQSRPGGQQRKNTPFACRMMSPSIFRVIRLTVTQLGVIAVALPLWSLEGPYFRCSCDRCVVKLYTAGRNLFTLPKKLNYR